MKQSVRLIAGPHDGEVVQVDPDQQQIVMRKEVRPAITARTMQALGRTVEITVSLYTRRVVHCAGEKISYFGPENMTDLGVLRHVLEP